MNSFYEMERGNKAISIDFNKRSLEETHLTQKRVKREKNGVVFGLYSWIYI